MKAIDRILNVTILYPDTRILGGVAIFIEAMRRAFDSDIKTSHFLVGRRATDTNRIKILFNSVTDALRLIWHVYTVRPDVVHINPSLNLKSLFRDGLFLLVLRLLKKREVLMFMHGWEEDLSAKIAGNRIYLTLFRYIYGWPAMTIVLASRFRMQMLSMGFCAEKIHVDSAMFDRTMFDGVVRQQHTDCRLVFISRLVAGKGMWELLEAYASLKTSHPELTLWLVGDGEEREAIERVVNEHSIPDVTITGFVSTETKAQILLNGDLFVFPTTYGEGCPASLLEAMAAGLPCITTGVGGIPDVFDNNRNGILLKEVSAQTVADAILMLLSDETLMRTIAEQNRNAAWSRFESHIVSDRIAAEYRSIITNVGN
ncbi:glycosyltransferase family 4 protein [Nitrosomonas sp.]|uniref:glycosyltransferase family 4 protein n=1 Tax=Nitrosomonas sp. TaxID=42353 RepID=UPI001E00AE25|nr:glycosyltransferase family 4 protein [Nitrosomonas sp.]MBX3616262.1 glycosyltransferase family 4 protein [Nitrosomonas sp.]